MSITFSIPNKRGFLGFQKVLKISELLGFVDSIFKLREGYIIMKRGR